MKHLLIVVAAFIGLAGGVSHLAATQAPANQLSAEIGLSETSPAGPGGGFAIPASGCSASDTGAGHSSVGVHDCPGPDITSDLVIARPGDTPNICWNTNAYAGADCTLSNNLSSYSIGDGCGTVTAYNTQTFSITCDAGSGPVSDDVTVLVLPLIEET